ncbi:MAG: mandelate racemase [Alphaproteobacteria bacterium]|nr:mandelate racemase [Alphaproteobacteria bacterium]
MTHAPQVKLIEVRRYEWPFRLRMPFRFGAVTHTHGRQAVVRALIRLEDGREGWGVAAESLAAKWFEKDPAYSDEDNFRQLRHALELTEAGYLATSPRTAFALYADNYADLIAAGRKARLSPLVTGFGPALIDRAILDALCRLHGISFYRAMQGNLTGMAPHPAIADLGAFDFGAFLAARQPAASVHARHTVGLVDPIVAADQSQGGRVNDGLPETLEEVVAAYGHRYFKLKVGGNVREDIERLSRIASVLDRIAEPYFASLDGNEQYQDAAGVLELWRRMQETAALARLNRSIIFIEQPIKRAAALDADIGGLSSEKPVIVDESDGELDIFPRARALGYRGISSKACKGFYKSFVNLARCETWNQEAGGARYFLSAEDLTTLAGTCVQQDLALINLLGLGHVERNGHHFVDGFAGRPPAEAARFLAAHPDLYRSSPGGPRLRIQDGRIALASLDCVGLGAHVEPDYGQMETMPPSQWPPTG